MPMVFQAVILLGLGLDFFFNPPDNTSIEISMPGGPFQFSSSRSWRAMIE